MKDGQTDTGNHAVKVISKDPKWFYCGQPGHCQQGMVFAINPPATGNTFVAFQAAAKKSTPSKGSNISSPSKNLDVGGTINQTADTVKNGWDGLPLGAKIGIIAGASVLVLLLIGGIVLCCRRRSKNKRDRRAGAMGGYKDASYRPLSEPAPMAGVEGHHIEHIPYGQDNGASHFNESSAALYADHHDEAAKYYDAPPPQGGKYETAWDARK